MRNPLLALIAVATLVTPASADFIVDEDFDSYEDQGDFVAVWTPTGIGANASGDLSIGGLAVSGINSIEIRGTSSDGHFQNQLTFTPTQPLNVGDQLIWSFDYYDKLPFVNPRNNFASLQTSASPDGSVAGQKISLGLGGNQLA